MIRAGEERDLATSSRWDRPAPRAIAFHLNRDRDVVHYAIAKNRLLAGLGPAGARMVYFFIAEEGASAAAYVVVSMRANDAGAAAGGPMWTIEEAGDRDPTGARVGAILQGLIARDPVERRPAITAWLPHGFLPPQLTIAGEQAVSGGDDGATADRSRAEHPTAHARKRPLLARRSVLRETKATTKARKHENHERSTKRSTIAKKTLFSLVYNESYSFS